MRHINYRSWTSFKSNLKKDLLSSSGEQNLNSFLFRGQADPRWNLTSSFDRIEKDKSKYDQLLLNFEQICHDYNFKEELLELCKVDKTLLAAFGQHYGLPTRLLDWTKSPYFAVFFAFSTPDIYKIPKNKTTIWAINKKSIAAKKSGGIEFVKLSTNKFNYRIKNQLGHFTLSKHSEDSINQYDLTLASDPNYNQDDLLWKIDLGFSSIDAILEDLNDMGINYSIVYPDIEGHVKQAVFKSGIGK